MLQKTFEPSKFSGLLRLKSPVIFELVTLTPYYAENNEIRLERLGNPRKVGVFLNSDKRQHRDTAAQDLQRQCK